MVQLPQRNSEPGRSLQIGGRKAKTAKRQHIRTDKPHPPRTTECEIIGCSSRACVLRRVPALLVFLSSLLWFTEHNAM